MGKKSCDELNELEKLRCDFWNELRKHLQESTSPLLPKGTKHAHWLNFKLGVLSGTSPIRQYVTIAWVMGNKAKKIDDCSWYCVRVTYDGLNGHKDNLKMSQRWFDFMDERWQTIQEQLGFKLKWNNKRKCDVYLEAQCVMADIRDRNAWLGYINDMRIQAEQLHTVFQPHALAHLEQSMTPPQIKTAKTRAAAGEGLAAGSDRGLRR